jgi:hypothetical protein
MLTQKKSYAAGLRAIHISPYLIEPELKNCMKELAQAYALYLGYLELDFEESAARQEADLNNELIYRTAFHAWKALGV